MLSSTEGAEAKEARRRQKQRGEGGGVKGSSNPLMYAAQQGNVDKVRHLIRENRPLLFERDRSRKTPLHYCCTTDKKAAQVADYIVMAAPELVDAKDDDGFTPLHLAVIAGNMPLVTFLLANHADINAVDNEKHTVVHWAAVCGETEALRAVMAAGAHVSTPDVHKGYPLHYAAQMCGGNDRDAVLGLHVLQALLSHNEVNVKVEDGDGRQPLLWAASAGSAKAILALIRAGSPVEAADKDGLTALHCAASRGHTDCIDTLLTLCGATSDVIDSNGCTALHYAVTLGHADATALLLAHGSDPNRQDRKGRSPAHCGCSKGQFETVKMISAHGANLWLKNARGDLPLHEAAASGRRDLVKWLLAMRPSQVNARNNDGRCPLHLAALNDNADMCKILLDAGAQINPILRTSKNIFMTPLDCALQRGFRSTAKYLQLHGGVPACRLCNGQQQTVNSAVSLQIRDDITFWGDTSSDSERENGEFNKHIKSQRKKLAQKYERKRASASGSELEEKISGRLDKNRLSRKYSEKSRLSKVRSDSASSSFDPAHIPRKPRNRFDYTNEIVINGNTEINIHQTREISVGRGKNSSSPDKLSPERLTAVSPLKIQSATGEKERYSSRPKSAKHGIKTKSTRSDSERSSTAKSSTSPPSIKTRTEEKKMMKPGKLKDQSTNTTRAQNKTKIENTKSTTSLRKEEVSREGIQGSYSVKQTKQSDQYSIISDTSEDQERNENILVEASIHEPPKSSQQNHLEDITERHTQINNSNEDFVEVNESNLGQSIEESLAKEERKSLVEQKNKIVEERTKDNLDEIRNTQSEAADLNNGTETVGEDEKENEVQGETETSIIEESTHTVKQSSTKNLEKILSHEAFLRNQESPSENLKINSAAREVANTAIGLISINIEQELSLKMHGMDQKQDSNESADVVTNETQGTKSEDISQSTEEVINTSESTVKEVLEKKDNATTIGKEDKEIESVREDSLHKVFGEIIPDEATSNKAEKSMGAPEKVKKFRKTRDTKKSIKDTSTSTKEGSTIPVSNENKTHKSFTVLEEQAAIDNGKKRNFKKRSDKPKLQKQRSKSEEREKEKVTLKRSKIPTALGKAMLSKSEKNLNEIADKENVMSNTRIPSLPNMNDNKSGIVEHYRSQSNMSSRMLASMYSDEKASGSEDGEDERRLVSRRRRTKRRSFRRDSRSAGSDYESSNLIDSGFEPSPRSTRVTRWKNMSDRGVNMTSVTQSIQTNIRRYHLERKIFQHLLDLKRMQIRSGQHNEAMLVKRAVDAYHTSCASTVGAGRYVPNDMTFRSFEKFLYDSLRKLQKNNVEYLQGLPEAPKNPLLCTRSTHRCMHATHAYTGVPCAAYLPKIDHHSIPKIGFNDCKPGTGGFLPNINNPKKAVTLELCHGTDKQVISLPADRLDQNKRYYVTFTVKGNDTQSAKNEANVIESAAHRHSRSD